jgi:hypothetical protein
MDKLAPILQFIELFVPYLIILLGFVLLTVAVWGIVIYLRQLPEDEQIEPKNRAKKH